MSTNFIEQSFQESISLGSECLNFTNLKKNLFLEKKSEAVVGWVESQISEKLMTLKGHLY